MTQDGRGEIGFMVGLGETNLRVIEIGKKLEK